MLFVLLHCTERRFWNREALLTGYQLFGHSYLWLLSINKGLVSQALVRANDVFSSQILWIQRPMFSGTVITELIMGVEVRHQEKRQRQMRGQKL